MLWAHLRKILLLPFALWAWSLVLRAFSRLPPVCERILSWNLGTSALRDLLLLRSWRSWRLWARSWIFSHFHQLRFQIVVKVVIQLKLMPIMLSRWDISLSLKWILRSQLVLVTLLTPDRWLNGGYLRQTRFTLHCIGLVLNINIFVAPKGTLWLGVIHHKLVLLLGYVWQLLSLRALAWVISVIVWRLFIMLQVESQVIWAYVVCIHFKT